MTLFEPCPYCGYRIDGTGADEDHNVLVCKLKEEVKQEWARGVNDAIKIVEHRKRHFEMYRDGEAMRTHPAVFATLDEILVFLRAMQARGEYADRFTVLMNEPVEGKV